MIMAYRRSYHSPQFLTKFIEIYKRNTCLWKITDGDYTRKAIREKGYSELVDWCRTIDPDATKVTVLNKIKNLKNSRRKEAKKIRISEKTNEIYVPSLWYYDLLAFTAEQPKKDENDVADDGAQNLSDQSSDNAAKEENPETKNTEKELSANGVKKKALSGSQTREVNNNNKRYNDPTFLKTFIEIYKKHPCLWDLEDNSYSNKSLRDKAFSELIQHCRSIDPNANQLTASRKINNLKSAYRREARKVKISEQTSGITGRVYESSLWYYDLMAFTDDQIEDLIPLTKKSVNNTILTPLELMESDENVKCNGECILHFPESLYENGFNFGVPISIPEIDSDFPPCDSKEEKIQDISVYESPVIHTGNTAHTPAERDEKLITKKYMTPEFLTEFIEIYKNNPCLWKPSDSSYAKKKHRDDAFSVLVEYSKKIDPNATRDTVSERINNLKRVFYKEEQKVRKSAKTANSVEEIYVPTLWYYDHLMFLAPLKKKRVPSKENKSGDDDDRSITDDDLDFDLEKDLDDINFDFDSSLIDTDESVSSMFVSAINESETNMTGFGDSQESSGLSFLKGFTDDRTESEDRSIEKDEQITNEAAPRLSFLNVMSEGTTILATEPILEASPQECTASLTTEIASVTLPKTVSKMRHRLMRLKNSRLFYNPEFLTKFINIYKKHTCLWKITDASYTNKKARSKAYYELLQHCKIVDPTATKETVRKKISNLKRSHNKETKKMEKENAGESNAGNRVPSLWYYDLLSFSCKQKKSNENEDPENFVANTKAISDVDSAKVDKMSARNTLADNVVFENNHTDTFDNISLENSGIDLPNIDIQNIDLQNIDLQNIDLQNIDLQNIDLQNLDLQSIPFENIPFNGEPVENYGTVMDDALTPNDEFENCSFPDGDFQFSAIQNAAIQYDSIQNGGLENILQNDPIQNSDILMDDICVTKLGSTQNDEIQCNNFQNADIQFNSSSNPTQTDSNKNGAVENNFVRNIVIENGCIQNSPYQMEPFNNITMTNCHSQNIAFQNDLSQDLVVESSHSQNDIIEIGRSLNGFIDIGHSQSEAGQHNSNQNGVIESGHCQNGVIENGHPQNSVIETGQPQKNGIDIGQPQNNAVGNSHAQNNVIEIGHPQNNALEISQSQNNIIEIAHSQNGTFQNSLNQNGIIVKSSSQNGAILNNTAQNYAVQNYENVSIPNIVIDNSTLLNSITGQSIILIITPFSNN